MGLFGMVCEERRDEDFDSSWGRGIIILPVLPTGEMVIFGLIGLIVYSYQ